MIEAYEQILCRVEDLPELGSRGFLFQDGQDQVYAVCKNGGIYVYLNLCPHERQPMGLRKDKHLNADKTEIICFAHGVHFEIETGECTEGVCEGQFLIRVPHRIEDGCLVIGRELPPDRH
jgi:nitrite reductase/ring-hydroxylating ferredoxin subunit